MNLYAYVNSAPLAMTDPFGLVPTYNPYRECVEKSSKRCQGTFRWVCTNFGGYKGPDLDAVVKRCLEQAPQQCKFLPDTDVPKKDRKRYDQQTEDYMDRCKKNCPPRKMSCEEWLECMAQQKP